MTEKNRFPKKMKPVLRYIAAGLNPSDYQVAAYAGLGSEVLSKAQMFICSKLLSARTVVTALNTERLRKQTEHS